jgi:hypothetical protein
MTKPSRDNVVKLEDLPNVGKAIARDLRVIGIVHPGQIAGKNPLDLYESLCRITGIHHDPCVLDVFMSIVHFMENGESFPWWSFTEKRKRLLKEKESATRS